MTQPKTNHFFDTISCDPQLLIVFDAQAKTQEELVLEVFNAQQVALAWWQVAAYLPDMNECSLKRSMSNLAAKGKLVKNTDKGSMILGISGKPCHVYSLIK